ncbi:germination protein YpeB [Schinkia azotoformans MEV2011]|uniref:Germination protein YpeB n=1 Tax=Schinkia azotoformans MEV2011 TaxID=1348973 RepID=A0A072NSZ3_SCHAZ|nr:germination protein YpeB [Schinkia azotoformans]KEF40566.1 germination protein YpeB [Schinkia azotoformans MEV2011]MEC1696027.1 germination protein YpeB [Schinkia azotoformans]MEC1716759.1 germination protein YpeB [Schinkia azotoformans]MEC1725469.1 germination protein YpeB [Schinkia azotoformans]MEC1739598.1 germination protein YpeB [Schinkia azotoformans]
MLRVILIIFFAIIVVGTGFWGYQEHQEKNAILIHAENNYQRAFHDLTYQIDLLQDKIGTTLAMNSRSQLSPALADVWRITSEAHSDVGQLPLTLMPFNKTEEFLSNIGDFSYRTAVRDLEKEPLTDGEYKTLQQLYSHATEIQQELRKVQHQVIENNLRWMDVELALASEKENLDNTIIDGFKTVEKNVEEYSESNFGPEFTQMNAKNDNSFKYLSGKEITKEEAMNEARKFLQIEEPVNMNVTENGKGSDIGFYSITINSPKQNSEIYMDITKKGGYPIWVLNHREIGQSNISLNEAAEKAKKYLNDQNFKDLQLFESAQYDHVGVFTFVAVQDGVRVYPDSIRVKVALDEGDIIGFSANDYLIAHHKRKIPKPEISLEQARGKVNPSVKVMEHRLAIINDDLGKEALCYEILGIINNDTYRIYVNAIDGSEEKVEKLKNAEPIYEQV